MVLSHTLSSHTLAVLQGSFQSKGCLRAGEQPAGGAGHEHPPGAQRAAVAVPPPQPCRELEV